MITFAYKTAYIYYVERALATVVTTSSAILEIIIRSSKSKTIQQEKSARLKLENLWWQF